MAKIIGTEEVRLSDLVISDAQARVRSVDRQIDELAESIRLHGLLAPIVVCLSGEGRYQVLMGQRRMLAHQRLGRSTILAAIIDEPVDETTAKVLSLSENLIRQDLDAKDVIDACTGLYKKYGTAKAVAEETGLPYAQVLRHVKYDRLIPGLQKMVDHGEVSIDVALRAQDTLGDDCEVNDDEALELAKQLQTVTGAQRRQLLKHKNQHPEVSVAELVTTNRPDERSKQIIVTLSFAQHRKLQAYARARGVTQDQAAASLITDGLARNAQLQEAAPLPNGPTRRDGKRTRKPKLTESS